MLDPVAALSTIVGVEVVMVGALPLVEESSTTEFVA